MAGVYLRLLRIGAQSGKEFVIQIHVQGDSDQAIIIIYYTLHSLLLDLYFSNQLNRCGTQVELM